MLMRSITRSYPFWILLFLLSITAAGLSIYLFPRAFPIISFRATMDRSHALLTAQATAETYHMGPINPYQSASFVADDLVKTFVELECGGPDAFAEIIRHELYYPYTWQVRLFVPYSAHELLIEY